MLTSALGCCSQTLRLERHNRNLWIVSGTSCTDREIPLTSSLKLVLGQPGPQLDTTLYSH